MHARSTPLNLSLVSPNLCGRAVRAAASLPRLLLLPGHGQSPRVRDHSSTPSGSDSPARYDTLLVDPPISGLFFLFSSSHARCKAAKERSSVSRDPIRSIPLPVVTVCPSPSSTHTAWEKTARGSVAGDTRLPAREGKHACRLRPAGRIERARFAAGRQPATTCMRA